MNAEGVGRIFAPLAAFADGPFPEYYEPTESPIDNPLHPKRSRNPVVKSYTSAADKYGSPAEGFNVVCTTYRLTEHYHYWTKNNPMNVQLVPEPFVEMPFELAADLGIKGGDKVKVSSARASYDAKAMVTHRIKPMTIDGKKTYQIGIPIHFGYRGIQEDAGKTARTLTNSLSPQSPTLTLTRLSSRASWSRWRRPEMSNGPLEIKAISGHAGTVPGRNTSRDYPVGQTDRCHYLYRLQGLRSGMPRMERLSFPRDRLR